MPEGTRGQVLGGSQQRILKVSPSVSIPVLFALICITVALPYPEKTSTGSFITRSVTLQYSKRNSLD